MKNEKRKGTIIRAMSGFYYVSCGEEEITCRARGKFRHQKIKPLVGDKVEILDQGDGTGMVDEIFPRKNEFQRPNIANIEQMVIVASGAIPVTDPFIIDQMTSIVEGRSCEAIICINKWDLVEAEALYDCYTKAGFKTLKISAETGEGIEELEALLKDKISAFTGNSGVGKSSILNAMDNSLHIKVGEVSDKLGRGRHTTRHIELFPLKQGGFIADTPGFSAFDVEKMEPMPANELEKSFRDFAPFREECQFIDCAHVKEKGCAVLEALSEGKLEKSRHASYVRLYLQAKERKTW